MIVTSRHLSRRNFQLFDSQSTVNSQHHSGATGIDMIYFKNSDMNQTAKSQWKTLDRFVEINSHWVKLIAEHLETTEGKTVEYWRVERADSVVILTIQAGKLLFPTPMYRPGVASATLDFPGGRVPAEATPAAGCSSYNEKGTRRDRKCDRPPRTNQHHWLGSKQFFLQSKTLRFCCRIAPDSNSKPRTYRC